MDFPIHLLRLIDCMFVVDLQVSIACDAGVAVFGDEAAFLTVALQLIVHCCSYECNN